MRTTRERAAAPGITSARGPAFGGLTEGSSMTDKLSALRSVLRILEAPFILHTGTEVLQKLSAVHLSGVWWIRPDATYLIDQRDGMVLGEALPGTGSSGAPFVLRLHSEEAEQRVSAFSRKAKDHAAHTG